MSVIRVAIPLLKGKRRFFLAKGRPWSLVEHVLLAALVIKPRTVDELAAAGDVPRRLVLEGLIRLMRAGWVALQQESKGVVFSATKLGHSVVDDDELPQVSKTISRWMNFVIDKLTGTLYRSREFPFLERHVVEQRAAREKLVWLQARDLDAFDDTTGVLTALFDDDEKFVGVEPSAERMVERYAVATVRNGTVEGLPTRAPIELVQLVKGAALKAMPYPGGEHSPSFDPGPMPPLTERVSPIVIDAIFKQSDLILGGSAHAEALHEAIKRARSRIIIHSTFISESGFASVRPELLDAAKRGAIVDVLWGEDDDKTDAVTTAKTVARIREQIDATGLGSSFRVHPFSTRSHSKILVVDEGRTERLSVIVGSCNWLSSSFQNYEASIRFSDPNVVATVLEQLADLTRGADRHWTELTSEMARLASDARNQRSPTGSKAKVTVVLGPQHAQFVRMARDTATKRMFVTSHRLGAATRTAIIVPAIAAVREKGLEVKAYYGMQSGNVNTSMAAELTATAGREGVELRLVVEPRLHAKILAWDDDNVLITSQNWLSADPGEANIRREIGLLVQATGVSRYVIGDFEASRRI
jgi:cardiolipin synthase